MPPTSIRPDANLPETTHPASADDSEALEQIELQSAVLVRHFEMLRRRTDVYADLDRAEYLLLRTLDTSGATDICGLASALGLDPSTAGRQITAMSAHGLVRREPSPTDRRRSIITPTAHGRSLMNRVRDQRRRSTADLLSGWSGEDLQTLARMFTGYNRTVAQAYLLRES
jgi:DNA-binding MarR family transcriptional regulator